MKRQWQDNVFKMAWVSWDRMERSKQKWGLSYRDIECFNLALLAKQGRIFLHNHIGLATTVKEDDIIHIGSCATGKSVGINSSIYDLGITLKAAKGDCAIFNPTTHGAAAVENERCADHSYAEKEKTERDPHSMQFS